MHTDCFSMQLTVLSFCLGLSAVVYSEWANVPVVDILHLCGNFFVSFFLEKQNYIYMHFYFFFLFTYLLASFTLAHCNKSEIPHLC